MILYGRDTNKIKGDGFQYVRCENGTPSFPGPRYRTAQSIATRAGRTMKNGEI